MSQPSSLTQTRVATTPGALLAPAARWLAWAPVPLLLIAIIALRIVDLRVAPLSPFQLAALDFPLRTVTTCVVIVLVGRSFLARGVPAQLLLGCGVAVWSVSGFVTSGMGHLPANLGVTISNLGILLAGVCHLVGTMSATFVHRPVRAPRRWLLVGYALVPVTVWAITAATFAGWVPPFFVDGIGGTLLRHVVLGTAILLFLCSALFIRERYATSPFAFWYTLALTLLAVSIFGMLIQTSRDSAQNWVNRSAQYLSSLYMLIAAIATIRQHGAWLLPLERALRESEERFCAAFAQGAVPMAMSAFDGSLLKVNPAFCALLGYTEAELRTRTFFSLTHPDDIAANQAGIARLLSGAQPTFRMEKRYFHRDGHLLWVDMSTAAAHDAAGRPCYIVTHVLDITARKQAEEELRAADRAKDEFLAVLSHELQTPLTNMLGWSAEALHDGSPAFMAQAMAVVHRNAERQKRLVDEILDMSRLIHRKIDLAREATELGAQARQAVEQVRHLAAERQLTLTLEPAPGPLPICADPARLQQCLGNLLHNSLKFTPTGCAITVRCTRADAQAALTITDTGRGIDAAALPTLFQPFVQVERDERTGGLGLGLTVARGILALHGGTLTADSPGRELGSTFTVTLPLADEAC